MWLCFFIMSISCVLVIPTISFVFSKTEKTKKFSLGWVKSSLLGVGIAAVLMFLPIHYSTSDESLAGVLRAFLLSVFNSMQVFALGCEFGVVEEGLEYCPDSLDSIYQAWVAVVYFVAPLFTVGFVMSFFKNFFAYIKYLLSYFKDVYVFSELNEKSLVLAQDIKTKHTNAAIVFTDVFDSEEDENSYELRETAKKMGAICFKKDVLAIAFKTHSEKKKIWFFLLGADETENLNHTLELVNNYKTRQKTRIYVFSSKIECSLLLSSIDKGVVKVRRINEFHSLINRILYVEGEKLFKNARPDAETNDGTKLISAVVVGIGTQGTEMIKALTWFCQMDGYRLEINAFDKDPLAKEKLASVAPELIDDEYNGVYVDGEAQYMINVHAGVDVSTSIFRDEIMKLKNATYVIVTLGNDDVNIETAVALRMYFERLRIHPTIQAIVYNSQQKKALKGIKNYKGQAYDIEFIGDFESLYTESVIIKDSLEKAALDIHTNYLNKDGLTSEEFMAKKLAAMEDFWNYEYNYRSSMASAIHNNVRNKLHVAGADKKSEEMTEAERNSIEMLEHRRWNAYMRAEGYIYSGSDKPESRNDLAKMHHNLTNFASLSEEDKRKDSRVGAKSNTLDE